MTILKTTLSALLASAALIAATPSHAYGDGTGDEQPPAEEQSCERAGLFGAAFGLCVAFCEANDCDASGDPDDRACSTLRENYVRATGGFFFPCETREEQPD